MKRHQVQWASARGLHPGATEGGGTRDHVLQEEHQRENLFDPSWWGLIEGKEHRWARALTSSQCFAVNLFAPLVLEAGLAREVFHRLFPGRADAVEDVEVCLEFTPPQAAEWLGESGQGTQVDVCFVVSRGNRAAGYVLVEVKLTEAAFGTCRGARPSTPRRKGNPDPRRCEEFGALRHATGTRCWLVTDNHRRYWDYLADGDWFDLDHVPDSDGCPFRDGLYQLMRNAVLARAMVTRGGARWADVAVCVHPGNDSAHHLIYPVAGSRDALDAIRRIAPGYGFEPLEPARLVAAVEQCSPGHASWAKWICDRYDL